jgi:hypothetical protein
MKHTSALLIAITMVTGTITYSEQAQAGWKLKALAAYCSTNEKCKTAVDKAVTKVKAKCAETSCAEKIKEKIDSKWMAKHGAVTGL